MSRRLLGVREAAEYLSLRPQTLRNWVTQRRIRSVRIGGRRLFDIRDLDALVEACREEPTPHGDDLTRRSWPR